jgi:hypothetical protein
MFIKPNQIKNVLDLAEKIQLQGENFTPLFVGAPGIAKSSEVQRWARENDYVLVDIRLAYFEGPELTGFPTVVTIDGKQIEVRAIPEFWPRGDKKALILLEEPNRGTTMAMNTLMQILTDRRIHTYELPKNAILCGAMNPEGASYDTNTMDSALLNRFQVFNVEYDKEGFISYMKDKGYHKDIVKFIETGLWEYLSPEKVKKGDKYVSPRTWHALDSAWKHCEKDSTLRDKVAESVLGFTIGRVFLAAVDGVSVVFASELLDEGKRSSALKRLKENADSSNYQAGSVVATCKDIVRHAEEFKIDLVYEVVMVLPSDVSISLVKDLEFETKDFNILKDLVSKYPDVKKKLRSVKAS